MGMIAGHVENAVVPAEAVGMDGDATGGGGLGLLGRALIERAGDYFSGHNGSLAPAHRREIGAGAEVTDRPLSA